LRLSYNSGVLTQNPPPKNAIITLFSARKRLFSTFDQEQAEALFQTFVKNQTWQCPTLVSNRAVALAGLEESFDNDTRSEYLPAFLTNSWTPDRRMKLYSDDERRERYALQKSIVGKLHRFGVPIIAGTDAGANYIYAGFSLHDELEQLVEAGLSPMATLQSATRNPAEVLGMLDSLGTVQVGKLADLVLLDANPLQNIANTRKVAGVIANGRYWNRQKLDNLLDEIRSSAAKFDE